MIERAAPGRNTSAQHIGATGSRQPLARQTPVWQRCGDDRPARADCATSARQAIPRWRLAYCRLLAVVSAAITAVETAATEPLMKEMMPAKAEPDAESRSAPLSVGDIL